jgi:hypothetical protein
MAARTKNAGEPRIPIRRKKGKSLPPVLKNQEDLRQIVYEAGFTREDILEMTREMVNKARDLLSADKTFALGRQGLHTAPDKELQLAAARFLADILNAVPSKNAPASTTGIQVVVNIPWAEKLAKEPITVEGKVLDAESPNSN